MKGGVIGRCDAIGGLNRTAKRVKDRAWNHIFHFEAHEGFANSYSITSSILHYRVRERSQKRMQHVATTRRLEGQLGYHPCVDSSTESSITPKIHRNGVLEDTDIFVTHGS